MLRHTQYTRTRLAQLANRMRGKIYSHSLPVEDLQVSNGVDRISYQEAQKLEYRPAKIGEQFGPLWSTFWFKAQVQVPQDWQGRVDLHWASFSEATLWMDGRSIQGLNHEPNSWDGNTRPDATLLQTAQGGETVAFQIEMACNGMGGETHRPTKHISPFVLDECEIRLFDPLAWEMYYDFCVLQRLETEETKDLDKTWAGELLATLNEFANIYNENDRSTWESAHALLKPLYEKRNAAVVHELSAIGHAHIDTAWLWPLAETWRKCQRSFSTATRYMSEYPEYKFSCSQAYQYAIIKELNPDLYERIKERVATGHWVPVGGTWIEPDCNIPSGEALCRQFLFGQRFFEKEFGQRCKEFWNPDVFGYNGQLPQIMREAGITRFLTQKLSWNHFNKPHHHTFTWQGIDGSEVLAHFPPANTYNANADVGQLRDNARNYKDHDRSQNSIMLFGYGDGGGGPTKEMLEILRRAKDLQGLPRTEIRSSDEFFTRLEEDITDRPTLVGELYFELHRGTYTSQAFVKKGNRQGELLLHDLEFLSALALKSKSVEYSQSEINALWEIVLLNQFHDILPGSSITLVYDDARRDYDAVQERGNALRNRLLEQLGDGESATPINTTSFCRAEVAEQPDGELAYIEVPSYGFGRVAQTDDAVKIEENADSIVLENAHLRAEFNRGGELISLLEKSTGRESLSGAANQFRIYDDQPTSWDAWDVDPFHLETAKVSGPAHKCEVIRRDNLRAEIAFDYSIGEKSKLRCVARLDAAANRVEFHATADWHEDHKMLKVAFPVDVRSMNATYEMQFGITERPTHFNTMYDLARYEVPGHKWIDLSEHGFGVAVLNDCKYGFSTHGNTMHISLLRAPKSPDPQADMGQHEFAYAIMPHAGGWREAAVVREAFAFNSPLLWAPGAQSEYSFASVNDSNLVLDTIKKAEDSDALVLRFYEAHGARGTAKLKVDVPFTCAVRCNVLEDESDELNIVSGEVEVPYTPFQVVSVKLS